MAIQDEALSVASLTGGERQGAGAFEELMRAVKSHLTTEHDAGRITGSDYTDAYVSAMNMALGNATQYLLQHEIANQQAKLLEEQIKNTTKQNLLLDEQLAKLQAETAHIQKQTLKLDSDIALVDANTAVATKQLLVQDEQIANAQKDILVKDSQITLQTKQGSMVDAQTSNETTRNAQITAQTAKINAEKLVLDQRKLSEEAQIKDTVGGSPVAGVIGKQIELYGNQADGYIRDAEQKVAKIMNDTFITRVSTDWDNPSSTTAGLNDLEVGKVMTALKAGIGV